MKQVVVIGLSRFGISLAKSLFKLGYEVMAVDENEEKVQIIKENVTHAVQLDVLDEEALKSLGINNFDVAIISLGQNDIEANLLVTVMLKDMGIKYVIARAENELHGKVLYRVGADKVVFPERDMGIRMAYNLASANVFDYLELSPEYSIVEFISPSSFVDKTLGELQLQSKYSIIILALKRSISEEVIVIPNKETKIFANDIIVAVGKQDAIFQVQR